MVRILLYIWEIAQVTMMNLEFQPTRKILNLTDFRVPGNLLYIISLVFTLTISDRTVHALINNYMVYVHYPFPGFQLKPQLRHLLPPTENRPEEYSLSILYSSSEVAGYDEAKQALYAFEIAENGRETTRRYPGAHPIF